MDSFFLKSGTGNSEAMNCLEGHSPLKRPAAVTYFDDLAEADYRNGKGSSQPCDFWERGEKKKLRDETQVIVVCRGEVCILKPAGSVVFRPEIKKEQWELRPKAMPVTALTRRPTKDVPSVLATIGANRFYAGGTFHQLNHRGNFKAIDWTAGPPFKGGHWDLALKGLTQLLQCLGGVEFVALVVKVFGAKGCFVPAYRGGVIQDVDIFVHNDSRSYLDLSGLKIPAGQSGSIQVKTRSDGTRKPDVVDYLIGFDVKGANAFNAKWVPNQVQKCPAAVT